MDSFFNLVGSEFDEEKHEREFEEINFKHTGRPNKLDFLDYSLSHLKDYDLDLNMIIFGKARSSKSTLACIMARQIYECRGIDFIGNDFYKKWVDNRSLYDNDKAMQAIKTSEGDVNLFDESYRTHDKRRSMSKGQVSLTGDINFFASKNSINLMLIQTFADIDKRVKGKSNAVILVYERGEGLLFADQRFIPLTNESFFEDLIENPDILKYPPMALYRLKQRADYVCELNWKKLEDTDPFFSYYKANKIKEQDMVIAKKIKGGDNLAQKIRDTIMRLYKKGMTQLDIAHKVGKTPTYINKVIAGKYD